MKTQTTLNFTASQLEQLKRIIDTVGWTTRDDETGKISTYISEHNVKFARDLAGILNRMDEVALTGTGEQ
jgi:hypothetical protein